MAKQSMPAKGIKGHLGYITPSSTCLKELRPDARHVANNTVSCSILREPV